MKLRIIFVILLILSIISCKVCEKPSSKIYKNYSGLVADSSIAIKIAEINWCQKYGRKALKFRPFRAINRQGIWTVYGTLKRGKYGGGPEIRIDERTGKVIDVNWGK